MRIVRVFEGVEVSRNRLKKGRFRDTFHCAINERF
jgi:hypothetical protein